MKKILKSEMPALKWLAVLTLIVSVIVSVHCETAFAGSALRNGSSLSANNVSTVGIGSNYTLIMSKTEGVHNVSWSITGGENYVSFADNNSYSRKIKITSDTSAGGHSAVIKCRYTYLKYNPYKYRYGNAYRSGYDTTSVTDVWKLEIEKTAHVHSYKVTSVTNATETSAGKRVYTCTSCGATKTETIPKTGHTWKAIPAKETTDDESGNTLYYQCTGCKKYFKADKKTETTVEAETIPKKTNFKYECKDGEVVITGYCGTDTAFTIPSEMGGSPVTSIGKYAFKGSSLVNVTIPDSVTVIGRSAFYNCTNLTNVQIPDSVVSIGAYAFRGCSGLIKVEIPDSVTEIGNYAFGLCTGLKAFEIPDSITVLNEGVFDECTNLTSVTIPAGVKKLDGYVFYGCTKLNSMTIPGTVTAIGEAAFYNCSSLTKIKIPESVDMIDGYVFYGCTNLSSVTIPDGVTCVEEALFYKCTNLKHVELPDSLTTIKDYAFLNCSSLSEITLPDSLIAIGEYAFRGCSSLTEVVIPDKVTDLSGYAFCGCTNLENATLPEETDTVSEGLFCSCTSLENITLPDSVTEIEDFAFYNCKSLRTIEIPESVAKIGYNVFYNCINLTIYGYVESKAEQYADANNITFAESTENQTGDSAVTTQDVALTEIGEEKSFSDTDLAQILEQWSNKS